MLYISLEVQDELETCLLTDTYTHLLTHTVTYTHTLTHTHTHTHTHTPTHSHSHIHTHTHRSGWSDAGSWRSNWYEMLWHCNRDKGIDCNNNTDYHPTNSQLSWKLHPMPNSSNPSQIIMYRSTLPCLAVTTLEIWLAASLFPAYILNYHTHKHSVCLLSAREHSMCWNILIEARLHLKLTCTAQVHAVGTC